MSHTHFSFKAICGCNIGGFYFEWVDTISLVVGAAKEAEVSVRR